MFFRQNILEKLIKEAYKGGGLHISHTLSDTDEPIYVIGGSWRVIWVGVEWLTKETKAAIIKLCGDLPRMGEAYRDVKDYPLQGEIENRYENALKGYMKANEDVMKTKLIVLYHNVLSVLQTPAGKIYLVDKTGMDLVDPTAIEREEGETEPAGPFLSQDKEAIYWRNNACTFMVHLCKPYEEHKRFWEHMEQITVI